MISWIFKLWAKHQQRRELENYMVRLIALNDLEMGMVSMNAALARNMVEKNAVGLGFAPGASLLHPYEFAECAPDHIQRFEYMFKEVRGKNQQAFAAGLAPWLHTLRAVENPGLEAMVKVMWREISKGFEQVPNLARTANVDPANIEGFFKVPDGFQR